MKHTRESVIALISECRKNGTRIDLSEQDLSWLDLHVVDLSSANLQSADLRGTNLRCADLQEANLSSANLQGADLRCADFVGADLQEADLRDANLDYCFVQLSCKTFGVKANKQLVSQLLYYLCSMDGIVTGKQIGRASCRERVLRLV